VDSDDSAKKGAGTVLATIGTGGVALRDVNLSDPEAGYFAASSGANRNPTHGYADFDVTPDQLTMQFVRGAGGTFSDSFTLTRDDTPANQPPVAAFTSSSSGLTASFDGSLSSDSDGEIVSYAWDFGPATGTGAKPDYTYATGGTYPVKLTVTDSAGATDVVTRDVTVSGPATNTLASDDFERTLSAAWGTADVGGAWTLRGQASRFSVSSGAGKVQVPDGATLSADLNAVSSSSTKMTAEFSVDKLLEGASIALVGRQTGTDAQRYIARLKLQADGKSLLYLMRPSATALQYKPTVTFVPGERYKLSLEVKGTNPTTLSTKVWKASDPEPAAWLGTTTDAAAGMQTAGRVGVYAYLSSGAGGPVTTSFHQLTVIKAN
jgi:PKD repeat protein